MSDISVECDSVRNSCCKCDIVDTVVQSLLTLKIRYKTSYLNEDVKCSEPSTLFSVSLLNVCP